MLTIRPEQMRVLAEAVRRTFELQVRAHLRQNFASQTEHASDEELLALVADSIVKAEGYGILSKGDATRFVEYTVLYSAGFDTRLPWAQKILNTEGISGTEKMDRIDRYEEFCGDRG